MILLPETRLSQWRPYGQLCLCCVLGTLFFAGCIQYEQSPQETIVVEAVDCENTKITEFLVLALIQRESVHGVEDPPKNHWLPPTLQTVQLVQGGTGKLVRPAYSTIQSVIFAPFVALGASSRLLFRVYARDFDVWRGGTHADELRASENGRHLIFLLRHSYKDTLGEAIRANSGSHPSNTAPPLPTTQEAHTSIVWNQSSKEWISESEYATIGLLRTCDDQILRDLADEAFWNQVESWFTRGRNLAEIQFLCNYYLEQFKRLQDKKKSAASNVISSRLRWLEHVKESLHSKLRD